MAVGYGYVTNLEATLQILTRLLLGLSILVKVHGISYKAPSQLPRGTEDEGQMKKVVAAGPKTTNSWLERELLRKTNP